MSTGSTAAHNCWTTSGAATSTSRSARWTCRSAACARPWNRTAWTPWCRPCAAPATGSRTCRPERRRGPGMSLSLLLRLAWRQSLIRLLVFYALAVAIGLLLGELWWALGLATVLVAARAYWRLYRVLRFLDWRRQLKSVDGQGLWAALETLIHRRQTEHRSRSRRLVRLLRGYRQAATATPDGALIVHRRDGRLVWFNQAARQLLGLRYPQSLDAPLAGLFPEEPRVRDWFAAGSSGEPLEDLAGPADPSLRLSLRLIPYSPTQWLVLVRDVTRLVHLEQVRRDFVANVSHELRTPLTVIHGYLDMIEPEEHPDLAHMVEEMRRQSERMT